MLTFTATIPSSLSSAPVWRQNRRARWQQRAQLIDDAGVGEDAGETERHDGGGGDVGV